MREDVQASEALEELDLLELLGWHVDALYTHDDAGRIANANDRRGGPAPRLYLGRCATGNVWRVRNDLPPNLAAQLSGLCEQEPVVEDLRAPPVHAAKYCRLLGAESPWSGPAYVFPPAIDEGGGEVLGPQDGERLRGAMDGWVGDVAVWQPFVAAFVGQDAVAVCASVRSTPVADEAGIETVPEHRGRGYALDVARLWARTVAARGARPLYSTSWANTASQRVATKLGLIPYASDYSIL